MATKEKTQWLKAKKINGVFHVTINAKTYIKQLDEQTEKKVRLLITSIKSQDSPKRSQLDKLKSYFKTEVEKIKENEQDKKAIIKSIKRKLSSDDIDVNSSLLLTQMNTIQTDLSKMGTVLEKILESLEAKNKISNVVEKENKSFKGEF